MQAGKENVGSPTMIILHTEKGYGCTFAEGVVPNHHMSYTDEQIQEAIENAKKRLLAAQAEA